MCSEARAPFADAGVVISGAADEFALGVFDIKDQSDCNRKN
jgi:hypothetical protein